MTNNNNLQNKTSVRRGVACNALFGVLMCILTASLFTTCEKVPDYCSRGNRYDPNYEFCFSGYAYPLCSGRSYNPLTQGCTEQDDVGTRCVEGPPVKLGTPCAGYTLSVGAAPPDGGRVTRTPDESNFAADEPVVLSAIAEDGYTFVGWAGASTSTNPNINVTMDSNKPLVAIFNPASTAGASTHSLVTTAFPEGSGTVNPAGATTYDNGTSVNVTATPAQGYTFRGWSGASTSTASSISVTMDNSKTLVAMFIPTVYTFRVNSIPETGGTVFVNGTALAGNVEAGTDVTVLAQAAPGYEFTGWSWATGSAMDITNPMTINITGNNQTLTANFTHTGITDPCTAEPGSAACCTHNPNYPGCSGITPPTTYMLTVNANPTAGGTVSRNPNQTNYNAGTSVTVTARPNGGYRFVNWAGASSSTDTAVTVAMNSNLTLTANFTLIETSNPCMTEPGSPACCAAHPGHSSCGTVGILEGDTLIYEGQKYPTVIINEKRWMAKNLNFNVPGSVCYDNEESNCDTYGRLYDWATAMGLPPTCNSNPCATDIQTPHHRGICPVGWHIPSDAEWTALTNFVSTNGAGANAGTVLKSRAPDWNGTNDYGFSALPGGNGLGSSFDNAGSNGYWWSTTELDASNARYRGMYSGYSFVSGYAYYKTNLFSLACQQDYAAWGSAAPPSRRP